GAAAAITGTNATITITPAGIANYNPAGFGSITLRGNLTINTGGNSTLIAPVLSRSSITVGSIGTANGQDGFAAAALGTIRVNNGITLSGLTEGGMLTLSSFTGNVRVLGSIRTTSNSVGG